MLFIKLMCTSVTSNIAKTVTIIQWAHLLYSSNPISLLHWHMLCSTDYHKCAVKHIETAHQLVELAGRPVSS